MKIAVFLPNWIGDAVMATPALRAVRDRFTKDEHEIVGVLRPYVADVLAGTELVDRTLIHDPRGHLPSRRGFGFVRRLRQERFDAALLLPNSLRSAWLAWIGGAKRRIGFDRDGRGWLLTDRVAPHPKSEPVPVIDEYLRLARELGCDRTSRKMELATFRDDEASHRDFWRAHDPSLRQRGVICLNPGGAFGAAKHWPVANRSVELARRIASRTRSDGARAVRTGRARADVEHRRDGATSARSVAGGRRADVSGLTKAAIRHAELLVTTDSGPRHFAPPFDVPVITLFAYWKLAARL